MNGSRLLACLACGDPIGVPAEGGEVACRCGARHTWGPTPAPPATVLPKPVRTPGETDEQYEQRRLAYLRKQADEGTGNSPYATFDAPPGLEHLELSYDDPTLPGLLIEAFRRAVERVHATHGALDAERNLFWIAGKYKNVAVLTNGDRQRGYAWLRTARELIRDPGLQHIIACNLADQARGDDDLAGARALIDSADPTPWQLPLDSQYRTSAGMLALMTDDIDGALQLVGERNGDVPFTRGCIYQACFMRTAALERAGRLEEAEAAIAFNLDALPDDLIADWLDGSKTIAPVRRTLERVRGRGDPDGESDTDLDSLLFGGDGGGDPDVVEAPRLAVPASITPRDPAPPALKSGGAGRIFLWLAASALVVGLVALLLLTR